LRKIKISVAIAPHVMEEIANYVDSRGRSRFIEEALLNELKRIKRNILIEAYRDFAKEAEKENQFFEGAIGDRLS
jgi:metal-responsive CopG/Arc/MetJ family transcriptional regulator